MYFSYVDDGRNPQLFTQHQLEKTLADHQAVQKKVEAYKVNNNNNNNNNSNNSINNNNNNNNNENNNNIITIISNHCHYYYSFISYFVKN